MRTIVNAGLRRPTTVAQEHWRRRRRPSAASASEIAGAAGRAVALPPGSGLSGTNAARRRRRQCGSACCWTRCSMRSRYAASDLAPQAMRAAHRATATSSSLVADAMNERTASPSCWCTGSPTRHVLAAGLPRLRRRPRSRTIGFVVSFASLPDETTAIGPTWSCPTTRPSSPGATPGRGRGFARSCSRRCARSSIPRRRWATR